MIEKLNFLLGEWDLEYNVPKTAFSEKMTGSGTGCFKRALQNKYIYFDYSFDYSASVGDSPTVEAHAVLVWDDKTKCYRFWWFESSGAFDTATCNLINDDTLALNWHNSLLVQTFQKISSTEVVLRMEHPKAAGEYELVLEVRFTKEIEIG